MKKLWLMLVFVFCLSATSCSAFHLKQGVLVENEYYTVTRKGGSVYLVYHKAEPPEDREIDARYYHRTFSGVQEMYDYYTGDEIFFPDSPDFTTALEPVKVFDLKDLKAPVLPEGWTGGECSYSLNTQEFSACPKDGEETATLTYFESKEDYLERLNSAQDDIGQYYYQTEEPSRNAIRYSHYDQQYEAGQDVGGRELVCYTFWSGFEKRTVFEWYEKGDEPPVRVEMFGKSNGEYMMLSLKGSTNPPSKDLLSEFGLKPYGSNPVLATVLWIGLGFVAVSGLVVVTVLLLRRRKKARALAGAVTPAPAEVSEPLAPPASDA